MSKLSSKDYEMLNKILAEGHELLAIEYLYKSFLRAIQTEFERNAENRASLVAIKKINNGKNQAIDALCTPMDRQEE